MVAMPPLRGGVLNDVRVQVSLLVGNIMLIKPSQIRPFFFLSTCGKRKGEQVVQNMRVGGLSRNKISV